MSFRDDFEKIIEPIQLNQNMPKEDFNAKSFPLIQFIRDHVPNQLYNHLVYQKSTISCVF